MPTAQTPQSGRSLEKELFIKATPERVFQALTTKEDLECWFVTKAEIDASPGGTLRFEWGPVLSNFGKILTLEAPHRLSYTWEAANPGFATLTFELTPKDNGTRLLLTHAGTGEGEDWTPYFNKGWDIHLQYLIAWLETGKERTW